MSEPTVPPEQAAPEQASPEQAAPEQALSEQASPEQSAAEPTANTAQAGASAVSDAGSRGGSPLAGGGGGAPAHADPSTSETPDDSKPITDWSTVDLGLPDGAEVDEAVLTGFGKAAVELGLTPKQARALASWQLSMIAAQRDALLEAGVQELARDWGGKAEANQQAVLELIARIDRLPGAQGFGEALGRSGATCFPGVVRGLLAVAGLLSEDSLGGGGAAGMAVHEETALEGLENALREARRGK